MPTMYDAVLIPGGGVQATGQPQPWVRARLDAAAEIAGDPFLVTLSAGTTHKAPPLSPSGFPIYESVAGATYLAERGVPFSRILTETWSWDTIGNAFFSRVVHADLRRLDRILVVTSDFHMPRTRFIFDSVYGLLPNPRRIEYMAVPDIGIDLGALGARRERESRSLEGARKVLSSMRKISELHEWLFAEHAAYSSAKLRDFGGSRVTATDEEKRSY